jgi:hypothetical protein
MTFPQEKKPVLRIRDLGHGAFLTLDSGFRIRFFRISDPKPIFCIAQFLDKK